MRQLVIIFSFLFVISGCKSGSSELEQKYQGCVMLKSMTANDPNFEITLDCEAGKSACEADMKSSECRLFLDSVKSK
jgi:hypothetical protein